MITLSNNHRLEFVIASGALGFDGKGWFWERALVWLGFIRPELFTVVIKTLTRYPRKGNLCWQKPWTWLPFSPWSCVRLIPGGSVNKVGLTNPGIEWWCMEVGPKLDFQKFPTAGSIFGDEQELVEMAKMLNRFDLAALEVNVSCPNTGHAMDQAQMVIDSVKAVRHASRHPIIVKVSVDQEYLAIARGLVGVAEAISLNSVPWTTAFPNQVTPLRKLEQKIGGGGGGVSGEPAQIYNWLVVQQIASRNLIPMIASSIMDHRDLQEVSIRGAEAFSFGAIHLPEAWKPWTIFTNPCKPTRIVEREMRLRVPNVGIYV